jgi:hypothetical protein
MSENLSKVYVSNCFSNEKDDFNNEEFKVT